jgi:hypothetical protein
LKLKIFECIRNLYIEQLKIMNKKQNMNRNRQYFKRESKAKNIVENTSDEEDSNDDNNSAVCYQMNRKRENIKSNKIKSSNYDSDDDIIDIDKPMRIVKRDAKTTTKNINSDLCYNRVKKSTAASKKNNNMLHVEKQDNQNNITNKQTKNKVNESAEIMDTEEIKKLCDRINETIDAVKQLSDINDENTKEIKRLCDMNENRMEVVSEIMKQHNNKSKINGKKIDMEETKKICCKLDETAEEIKRLHDINSEIMKEIKRLYYINDKRMELVDEILKNYKNRNILNNENTVNNNSKKNTKSKENKTDEENDNKENKSGKNKHKKNKAIEIIKIPRILKEVETDDEETEYNDSGEKLYKINNDLLDDYRITKSGKIWSTINKIFLALGLKNGYYMFKSNQVNVLVASTFIEKPNEYDNIIADHINETKTDNRVENLQWITQKENCNKHGKKTTHEKAVHQIDMETGEIIKTFPSVALAAKSTGAHTRSIHHALDSTVACEYRLECEKRERENPKLKKVVKKRTYGPKRQRRKAGNKKTGNYYWAYVNKDDYKMNEDEMAILIKNSKKVYDYEFYRVQSNGTIFSTKTCRLLKPVINADGRAYITLSRQGKDAEGKIYKGAIIEDEEIDTNKEKQNVYVHRIVADHYLPNKPREKSTVDHISNNLADNRVENLRWSTVTQSNIIVRKLTENKDVNNNSQKNAKGKKDKYNTKIENTDEETDDTCDEETEADVEAEETEVEETEAEETEAEETEAEETEAEETEADEIEADNTCDEIEEVESDEEIESKIRKKISNKYCSKNK